jgi:hypothetical protein
MLKSESIGKLALALAKAQHAMKAAVKDSVNPHFRSNYADLASIWDACRNALHANELSVTQIPTGNPETGVVGMITILMHSSGEWIGGEANTKPKDITPQSVGSAITYLRRYGLASVVGVVSDDDDAEAAQPKQSGPKRVEPAQQKTASAPPADGAEATATTFWQAVAKLEVDKAQATAIKDNHTKGGKTDWAAAVQELRQLEAA